jgi:hypothetical protein
MTKEDVKRYLKPIADGLFGRQRRPTYERPHFKIRDLNQMLEDLVQIQPEEWFRYAFSREPINGKFTDAQRIDWTRKAILCGKEYARKTAEKYGTRNSIRIAEKMGMNITYPDFPDKTDRVMFAQYTEPNNIKIFMDAVRKADRLMQDPKTAAILTEKLNIPKTLLAHELFHNIEEENKDTIFTRTEKFRLWSVGKVHNDSSIIALSEIAAMAYSQELNQLPYSTYVLDMFLVYGYSPEEASGLYEEMMEDAGRKPDGGEAVPAETMEKRIRQEKEQT